MLAALILVAGCASEKSATEEAARTVTVEAAGGEVVLTGTLACGHCTFHKTPACAAGLQTADGKMYILDGVAEGSELFEERNSEKQVKVVGTLGEMKDQMQHVMVESYEM
jgi:hypothetical protein